MGLFDIFKKKNKVPDVEVYSEQDLKIVESSIEKYFGSYPNVFHEIVSETVHLDIAIIEPTEDRDYYTLVTFGAGAKEMNNHPAYNRIELMIHLPSYWNVQSDIEEWYWPIRTLKVLARFPFDNDTWIGQGHSLQFGDGFVPNNDYYAVLLDRALDKEGEYPQVHLTNGSQLHFLQVIPIFEDEMNFKIENGADEILELLPKTNFDYVFETRRESVVK